jgi:hypothetical protein
MEQSPSWKLIVPQRIKKFFAFCGTWRFITTFAKAHYLSVSWYRSVHSPSSHPVGWRYILILSSHLRLGLTSGRFPSAFRTISILVSSPSDVAFEWVVVLFIFREVVYSSLYQEYWLVWVFWWSPPFLYANAAASCYRGRDGTLSISSTIAATSSIGWQYRKLYVQLCAPDW